jgi:hypothetical protein
VLLAPYPRHESTSNSGISGNISAVGAINDATPQNPPLTLFLRPNQSYRTSPQPLRYSTQTCAIVETLTSAERRTPRLRKAIKTTLQSQNRNMSDRAGQLLGKQLVEALCQTELIGRWRAAWIKTPLKQNTRVGNTELLLQPFDQGHCCSQLPTRYPMMTEIAHQADTNCVLVGVGDGMIIIRPCTIRCGRLLILPRRPNLYVSAGIPPVVFSIVHNKLKIDGRSLRHRRSSNTPYLSARLQTG